MPIVSHDILCKSTRLFCIFPATADLSNFTINGKNYDGSYFLVKIYFIFRLYFSNPGNLPLSAI
jgi:hypothetical protein